MMFTGLKVLAGRQYRVHASTPMQKNNNKTKANIPSSQTKQYICIRTMQETIGEISGFRAKRFFFNSVVYSAFPPLVRECACAGRSPGLRQVPNSDPAKTRVRVSKHTVLAHAIPAGDGSEFRKKKQAEFAMSHTYPNKYKCISISFQKPVILPRVVP